MSTPSRRRLHAGPPDAARDEQAHVRPRDGEDDTLRVAIDNDFPLVVMGLTAVLAEHTRSVRVVPLDASDSDIDLVLKDAFAMNEDLADYIARSPAPVVVFAASDDPAAVQDAVANGAAGYVHKGVTLGGLVDALQRIHAGQPVVELGDTVSDPDEPEVGTAAWPGQEQGLTERESEVLSLICQGLSNQQVAQNLYLSINSVKTYIRTLYRKIGAQSRSQAVIWGLQRGFSPRPG
jgi:two-component system, NarL family, response regulator LiaR